MYEVVPLGAEAIVSSLVSIYEELTGNTILSGSPEDLFVSWVAAVIVQERALMNFAANQSIPSRATGKNLDALADLFYLQKRPGATAATTTMRFFVSEVQDFPILIPKGTRVTASDTEVYWATDKDVYLDSGEEHADVTCTCTELGKKGNGYRPGQINTIVDLYEYFTMCTNLTESANGADEATDEEFYNLLVESQHAYSTAGSRGAYEYHAKTATNAIADVMAVRTSPGHVSLYTIMDDGSIATEETKARVLQVCSADSVRPLSDYVVAEDPSAVNYNIDLTYYFPEEMTESAAVLDEKVQAAVDQYVLWQQTKLGRDIVPAKLIQMIMDTGVKRVTVREPVFTVLADGADGSVPAVASLGTKTVTNGGYEHE